MAGTVTASEETYGTVKKITLAWTSATSGDVSGTATSNAYSGAISRFVTVPSTSAAPDLNYDVSAAGNTKQGTAYIYIR
jgi:hypothetical protein